jgi:predicted HTH domain antitoxin
MQVTLNLPDDISAALEGRWKDVPRQALEALAVEAYRTGALSENQIRRLLRFESRFEVHALLKEHRVPFRYSEADVARDLAAHRELGILRGR